MSVEVRPFRRDDRDQVTTLVNAHVQAVMPGVSVSVNAVLSQLEREPGEFIVDPWVAERTTLVAVERERIVAAAHLRRYASHADVGETYRDAGEIYWLVCWRDAPYWPDTGAGDLIAEACVAQLSDWRVARYLADGSLPAAGVYGVPDSWPHIRAVYERAGFRHEGTTEIVLVADVAELRGAGPAPLDGLAIRRELGINGTRFAAVLGDATIGYVEVASDLTSGGALARYAGWADIGNLCVDEPFRRRGIGTWLFGHAADWLRLGRVTQLLAYEDAAGDAEERAFLERAGFRELTRTQRGWVRDG